MNIDLELWDSLITDLYQSMLNPESLANSVDKANTALNSDLCHIVGFAPCGKETVRIFTDSNMGTLADLYAGYYTQIDPRRKFMATTTPGETYKCSNFYDQKFVSGSEFYQDFLIPQGFRYVIGSCLYRSEAQSIFVAFNHGRGRPDFSEDEERFFRLYIAHLSKVISGIIKLAPVSRALDSETALDALQFGVIGLTSVGKVCYTNATSEKFLGTHLSRQVLHGRLCEGSELSCIFQQVLKDGHPRHLSVPSFAGTSSVYVSVIRTKHTTDRMLVRGGDSENSSTRVLLIMSSAKERASPAPSQLIVMFGLSPTEARLAHQLSRGMSINEYAERFCVSVATVRTQLRAILRKTGESRQQDLVRMLVTIPVISSPTT